MASAYPAEVKATALAIYATDGGAIAARQTGVPAATIRSWASRTGVAKVATEKTRAATEAARCRWQERQFELADRIGEAAERALLLTQDALMEADARTAKAAAVTLGVLIDKAELLARDGGRHEYLSPEDAEREAAWLDALAAQRAAMAERA